MTEVGKLVLELLSARGVSAAEAEKFLNPSVRDLVSPLALDGVEKAVGTILAAVKAKREIVVFGDYDCDGVSATAILVEAIGIVGGKVSAFIPARLAEGYGMTAESVARMFRDNPGTGLVVTVDNGINALDEVAALNARGVEVVVTDHHLPTLDAAGRMLLPAAAAVVNPKVAAPESLRDICGAAVAFFLANALVTAAKEEGLYSGGPVGGPLLVLAGLATVTDVMPLLGQNRILVAEALKRFRALAPLGLKELYARASRSGAAVLSSRDFGFLLGPRINAAGRLADGSAALELVLAKDVDIAREAARIVDGYNSERREIEARMIEQAKAQVVAGAAAQVIDLPDGHPGVAGIVAARVMEALEPRRPVAVAVGAHGSARAPEGFNVRDLLGASAAFLDRFGGHQQAAGFSVKPGETAAFRAAFAAAAEAQLAAGGVPADATEKVDAVLKPSEITLELAEELRRMEPYGEGNPEPRFRLEGVYLKEVRPMGAEGKHLALSIGAVRGVWWGHGAEAEELRARSASPVDIDFTIEVSEYGTRHAEFRVVGMSAGGKV